MQLASLRDRNNPPVHLSGSSTRAAGICEASSSRLTTHICFSRTKSRPFLTASAQTQTTRMLILDRARIRLQAATLPSELLSQSTICASDPAPRATLLTSPLVPVISSIRAALDTSEECFGSRIRLFRPYLLYLTLHLPICEVSVSSQHICLVLPMAATARRAAAHAIARRISWFRVERRSSLSTARSRYCNTVWTSSCSAKQSSPQHRPRSIWPSWNAHAVPSPDPFRHRSSLRL